MSYLLGPQTFGYSNAVVKAMKSFLLPQTTLRELIVVDTVNEIIEILENTNYKESFVKLSTLYSGVDLVEHALSENLAKTCKRIVKVTPQEAKPLILSLLKRFDIYNLKTILIGKSIGASEEEINRLIVNAGSLRKNDIKRLIGLESVDEIIASMQRTEYGMALKGVVEEYRRTKDLGLILNSMDMHYYSSLALAADLAHEAVLKKFIIHEVNSKNIMNVLRARANNLSSDIVAKLIIEGGSFDRAYLLSLARLESVKEIVEKLGIKELNDAYVKFEQDKSLVHFEIAFEKQLVKESTHEMRIATLSTSAIVGYLFLKELEIANIRRIIRAKEYDMPKEKIMEIVYNVSEKV
ncbi:V-type ATPase subunit [Candidatus Micrarchaeota archaeon]|nr:V-type ATPase subunit [Candidatus Micrarchaeota archaeon]